MQKFDKFCLENAFDVEISLAKGIIFTKISLANGAILKPWAAHPCPKFSQEPPPPRGIKKPSNMLIISTKFPNTSAMNSTYFKTCYPLGSMKLFLCYQGWHRQPQKGQNTDNSHRCTVKNFVVILVLFWKFHERTFPRKTITAIEWSVWFQSRKFQILIEDVHYFTRYF